MTSKELELILFLIARNEYSTYGELKTALQKSERTVRYYLEQANQALQQQGFSCIEQDRKLGVRLQLTAAEKQHFFSLLDTNQEQAEYYPADERILRILFSILREQKPTFATTFIDELITSKSSIDSDMKTIRKLAQRYGVALKSTPREGFKFQGDEWSVRLFINNVINQYLNLEMMMDNGCNHFVFSKKEKIVLEYLNEKLLFSIYRHIEQMARSEGFAFNEIHFRQMAVIFAVWYRRFTQGHTVISTNCLPLRHEKLHSYQMVVPLLETMKLEACAISEYERYYLCLIIDSFNIKHSTVLKIDWGDPAKLGILLRQTTRLHASGFSRHVGLSF